MESNHSVATSNALVLASGLVTYILFFGTAGILIIMIIFGYHRKRWCFTSGKGKMFISCFAAILLGWFRLLPYLYLFHISYVSYDPEAMRNCELLVDVAYCFVGMGIMSIYVFLWLRQRVIYRTHIVKSIANKWLQYVSSYSIVWIIICTIILLLGYWIPETYRAGPMGCEYIPSNNQSDTYRNWNSIRKYVVLATVLITEIFLVFLFIYPMVKIRFELRTQQNPPPLQSNISGRDTTTKMIRRSLICSVIVIVVDVIFFIMLRRLSDVVLIAHLFTNIGIFLNEIVIILSLGDCLGVCSSRCVLLTQHTEDTSTNIADAGVCRNISLPIDNYHVRFSR